MRLKDGEFDLRGLQLGGDDEWVPSNMGSAEQRTSGTVIVGYCMYVCTFIWLIKLNCCADCSQSEKEGSLPRERIKVSGDAVVLGE